MWLSDSGFWFQDSAAPTPLVLTTCSRRSSFFVSSFGSQAAGVPRIQNPESRIRTYRYFASAARAAAISFS
jgi:hypothetical protein